MVEEVLSGIRTVFAFGGEKIEVNRYKKQLEPAVRLIERKGIWTSIEDASMRLLYFISCALSFWFGVQWVLADRDKNIKAYTIPVLITVRLIKCSEVHSSLEFSVMERSRQFNIFSFFVKVFLNLVTSAENISRLPPFMDIFSSARGSAKNVFAVIDRKSKIDPLTDEGNVINLSQFKGNIEFKDIFFNYPSRSDVKV